LIFSPTDTQTQEDGFLHAYELYDTRLNAELAVLSACNTGSGRVVKGEGVLSLSRAFKYAGCPNIAMSLWKADDNATHEIMIHFFKGLRTGMGKTEALRDAQLAYLAEHTGPQAHPYYWATFVMIGDDSPLSGLNSAGLPWWGWGPDHWGAGNARIFWQKTKPI
jgi:CHAT domain-containing protein